MMAKQVIQVFANDEQVANELCKQIIERASKSISDKDIFTLGLSGGSLQKYVCGGLAGKAGIDWSKWRFFFCDERVVPFDDPESTYEYYQENLFSKVSVPPENVAAIDPALAVDACAEDYTAKLRKVFPGGDLPQFDLLLLGMGPDGHTASLFPGHPLLKEKSALVAPISDSPKPPPNRITLTLPVINNARAVIFACCGQGKAANLKKVIDSESLPDAAQRSDLLPCAMVRPATELIWLVDESAASLLDKSACRRADA